MTMTIFYILDKNDKVYKDKFRCLQFNLKDVKNPELRGQVLTCAISPHALVRMTPKELASRELSKWREEKAEEFLKTSIIDEETAATISSLAARKTSEKRRQECFFEEHDMVKILPMKDETTSVKEKEMIGPGISAKRGGSGSLAGNVTGGMSVTGVGSGGGGGGEMMRRESKEEEEVKQVCKIETTEVQYVIDHT